MSLYRYSSDSEDYKNPYDDDYDSDFSEFRKRPEHDDCEKKHDDCEKKHDDCEKKHDDCCRESARALKKILELLDELNNKDLCILDKVIDRLLCSRSKPCR